MSILVTQAALPFSSSHKHQVFLSFRGKDTGKNFTDHLYKALLRAKIRTYREEKVERDKNIGIGLQYIIKESEIAVIIFSKNYGESKWCLDELLGILENSKTTGQIVIPVFYDVQPRHVRFQIGSFGEGFLKHEECQSRDKIEMWRAALREVADLEGMVWQNEADGVYMYESQFIQDIIQNIKKNLFNANRDLDDIFVLTFQKFDDWKENLVHTFQGVDDWAQRKVDEVFCNVLNVANVLDSFLK